VTEHSRKRTGDQRLDQRPEKDRRATHRVTDEQKSGQGSLSALSKLKMIERKRAQFKPPHDDTT
jgi:hypothetical protein